MGEIASGPDGSGKAHAFIASEMADIDTEKRGATAIAMTAIAAGRDVVRYIANGASCLSVKPDSEGLQMLCAFFGFRGASESRGETAPK